jgi:ubiquinone/menaquinone biosynthesis C-methylase UbiE
MNARARPWTLRRLPLKIIAVSSISNNYSRHHMFTLAQDGELHLAPLEKDIQKALDVGCGTGIWAM